MGGPVQHGAVRRLDNVRRRGKIGVAPGQGDDIMAGQLQRFGLVVDGQRGRRGNVVEQVG